MKRFRLIIDGTLKQPNRFDARLLAVIVAGLLALFGQLVTAVVFLAITLLLIDIKHELRLLNTRRRGELIEINERDETQ